MQILLMHLSEVDGNDEEREKFARMLDERPIDIDTLIRLWCSTLNVRRVATRNMTTQEIMIQFPGYAMPDLVRSSFIFPIIRCTYISY
jgi:hypothetical protein